MPSCTERFAVCSPYASTREGARLARWLRSVLERRLLRLLIVGQMRARVLIAELFRTGMGRLLGDAALGFVRRQFLGGIEVPPARIATVLIGPRTC